MDPTFPFERDHFLSFCWCDWIRKDTELSSSNLELWWLESGLISLPTIPAMYIGIFFWSNYSDLTRVFTPNGGLVREIPLFQGNP